MKFLLAERFTWLALLAALLAPAIGAVAIDWVLRRDEKHLADLSIDRSEPVG